MGTNVPSDTPQSTKKDIEWHVDANFVRGRVQTNAGDTENVGLSSGYIYLFLNTILKFERVDKQKQSTVHYFKLKPKPCLNTYVECCEGPTRKFNITPTTVYKRLTTPDQIAKFEETNISIVSGTGARNKEKYTEWMHQ